MDLDDFKKKFLNAASVGIGTLVLFGVTLFIYGIGAFKYFKDGFSYVSDGLRKGTQVHNGQIEFSPWLLLVCSILLAALLFFMLFFSMRGFY